jgi:hypothetical protein
VGAQKSVSKLLGPTCRDRLNRQTTGIAGNHRLGTDRGFHPFHQVLLNGQVLDDRLNHPIHGRQTFEVVLVVAQDDPFRRLVGIENRW